MNGRAWSSALVLFVGVAVAAALQEFCGPFGAFRAKIPALMGVAVYYAMRREPHWGLAAAVWCGVLEDGLGPVPLGASLLAYLGAWALCFRVLRPQVEEGALSCALAGAALAPALLLVQYLALRLAGGYPARPASFLACRLLAGGFCGGAAALAAALALRGLDWISANVGLEEAGDEVGWTGD